MFQNSQFTYMMLRIDEERSMSEGQEKSELFIANERNALNAHNYLIECKLYKDAHQALGVAHDIKQIYKLCFGMESGLASVEDITARLHYIEKEVGVKPFKSVIEEAHNTLKGILQQNAKPMRDATEEDLLALAKKILEAYSLPEDRLPNLILDLKNQRLFDRYGVDSDFELLIDQDTRSPSGMALAYKNEPSYVLRNKKMGFQSLPSKNVSHLLQFFGLMPNG